MVWPAWGFSRIWGLENIIYVGVFLAGRWGRPAEIMYWSGVRGEGQWFAYTMTLRFLFSVLGTVVPARGGLASTVNLLYGLVGRLEALLIQK